MQWFCTWCQLHELSDVRQTARAAFEPCVGVDLFTDALNLSGHKGMLHSVLTGTSVVDLVGQILQDLHFASVYVVDLVPFPLN